MYENVNRAIKELKKAMSIDGVDPTKGLPEDLFIFSTTLVPIVNIDLFITDDKHRLLLSWREDQYNGKGWHIPGGCVRLKESLEERVVKTAEKEIGVPIVYNPKPVAIREIMASEERSAVADQLERCHNVSFLYQCHIEQGYTPPNEMSGVKLQWFDKMPDELLQTHIKQYGDIIEKYFNGGLDK